MIRPNLPCTKNNKIDIDYNPYEEESVCRTLNDDDMEDEESERARTTKDDTKGTAKFLFEFQKRIRQCYKHRHCHNSRTGPVLLLLLQQVTSLSFYIITWVANGEILQGIANGRLCPGNLPYRKPAFLTWYSYNYMILSGIFVVYPYVVFYHKEIENKKRITFSFYVTNIWAGRMGWKNAVLVCTLISCMLLVLNFLYIVGLDCVSVSLSNAVYQLQTPFTIGLSVYFLKDTFVASEAVGIILSLVGVALIVLPPLVGVTNNDDRDDDHHNERCPFFQQQEWSSPTLVGILATLGSAAIGSAYLVSWRVLSETKSLDHNYNSVTDLVDNNSPPPRPSRLEGFVDTHMTLAMIGFCNLILGWPFLILMDQLGLEALEMPPAMGTITSTTSLASSSYNDYYDFYYYYDWGLLLNANGLMEYAFDASCAVAIYMTSPVATSIIAPLTIPLSMAMDHLLYRVEDGNGNNTTHLLLESSSGSEAHWSALTVVGVVVILVGVVLLEVKPDLPRVLFPNNTLKRR